METQRFTNKNHITIPGFAVAELKLSGNELVCFSLIYGFCQDGESEFYGSLNYITSALNIDKRNVIEVIKRLVQKKLIVKRVVEINRVKKCFYSIPIEVVTKHQHQCQKITRGSDETSSKVVLKHHQGSVETSPNNIIDNIDNNISDNTKASALDVRWEKFNTWLGQNCPYVQKMQVPITKEQFAKLVEKYSNERIITTLTQMNNWKPLLQKNRSAYQTLINWITKDEKRNNEPHTSGCKADRTIGTNYGVSDV